MIISRNEFLKVATVKHETIELQTLKGAKVTLRLPTVAETKKIEAKRKEVVAGELDQMELMFETCRACMVEPAFFTDEELENLSANGLSILTEIYFAIPKIGLTKDEKEDYNKRVAETMANNLKQVIVDEVEEAEKKSKKKSLSSN